MRLSNQANHCMNKFPNLFCRNIYILQVTESVNMRHDKKAMLMRLVNAFVLGFIIVGGIFLLFPTLFLSTATLFSAGTLGGFSVFLFQVIKEIYNL